MFYTTDKLRRPDVLLYAFGQAESSLRALILLGLSVPHLFPYPLKRDVKKRNTATDSDCLFKRHFCLPRYDIFFTENAVHLYGRLTGFEPVSIMTGRIQPMPR